MFEFEKIMCFVWQSSLVRKYFFLLNRYKNRLKNFRFGWELKILILDDNSLLKKSSFFSLRNKIIQNLGLTRLYRPQNHLGFCQFKLKISYHSCNISSQLKFLRGISEYQYLILSAGIFMFWEYEVRRLRYIPLWRGYITYSPIFYSANYPIFSDKLKTIIGPMRSNSR